MSDSVSQVISDERNIDDVCFDAKYSFVGKKHCGAEGIWFVADCEGSKIGLRITSSILDSHQLAIHMAMALSAEEQLIQHLENWLNHELDFSPADHAPDNSVTLKLKVPSTLAQEVETNTNLPEVIISLPLHLLLNRTAPNWFNLDVVWSSLECSVVLSEFCLSGEEAALLHAGAILLLPNSFSPSWQVDLFNRSGLVDADILSLKASLDVSQNQITFIERNNCDIAGDHLRDDHNMVSSTSVRCVCKLKLPIDFLLGWTEGRCQIKIQEHICADRPGNTAPITILREGAASFRGSLIKIADGFGVVLEKF